MTAAPAIEANFDALVGPTHHYAGLARGNLASQRHKHARSNPRAAALEGLAKMKALASLGLVQGVLPPHERPDLGLLRRLGFHGRDADVLRQAHREAPELLAAASSASSMWAANAATVCPSPDSADGRVHFTPANLVSQLHRAIETATTATVLQRIFADGACFTHHAPLPAVMHLRDEGAANHTRLCRAHGEPGVQVFAYGSRALSADDPQPRRHPARQTFEASAAVARLHRLDPGRTLFFRQSPEAIDAGVFHNDVIAVGHRHVLLYHAQAFVDGPKAITQLRHVFARTCGLELAPIEVPSEEVALAEAVDTYLFNSQLVDLPGGAMAIVCPAECREHPRTRASLERLTASGGPITSVRYVDVRQSMRNGGGPACLRLRVVLTPAELERVHPGVLLDDRLHRELVAWVERHYRDALSPDDLADPRLIEEGRAALDELARVLGLGAVYPFQCE